MPMAAAWLFVALPALLLRPPAVAPRSQAVVMADNRLEVCQNKYCRKKGSVKTLELLKALADGRDDVIVSAADMSHTEHGCFDECMMGPNVRLGGEPQQDKGRVINEVKAADVDECQALIERAARAGAAA